MPTRIAEDKTVSFNIVKPTAETLAAIDDDLHDRTEIVNIDEFMAESLSKNRQDSPEDSS